MCVCVCVCVREREKERERGRGREGEGEEREREDGCTSDRRKPKTSARSTVSITRERSWIQGTIAAALYWSAEAR